MIMNKLINAEEAKQKTDERNEELIEKICNEIAIKISESISKGEYSTKICITSSIITDAECKILENYGYKTSVTRQVFDAPCYWITISWE